MSYEKALNLLEKLEQAQKEELAKLHFPSAHDLCEELWGCDTSKLNSVIEWMEEKINSYAEAAHGHSQPEEK